MLVTAQFVDGPLDGTLRVEECSADGAIVVVIPVRVRLSDLTAEGADPTMPAPGQGRYVAEEDDLRAVRLGRVSRPWPIPFRWQGPKQYAVVWADEPALALSPSFPTKGEAYEWLRDYRRTTFGRPGDLEVRWVPAEVRL